MIALSYGLTYIWGTVGIILICKYLPRWWGIDAKAAAKKYEEEKGVPNVDDAGLTGYRPLALRAYRLTNNETAGQTVRPVPQQAPGVQGRRTSCAASESLGAADDLVLQKGDVIALGGRLEAMTAQHGPDRARGAGRQGAQRAARPGRDPGHQQGDGRQGAEGVPQHADFAGQVALHHIERGGVAIPMGLNTKLERFDVLFVGGDASPRSSKAAALLGKIARPSTSTDLLTLALGMILGFLIGAIAFPLAGSKVGLGNAGGLLVSGIIVSSIVSRLRFFGSTPNAARNILEDLGLVVFIAIVGVNAGAGADLAAHRRGRAEDLHRRLHRHAPSRRSWSGRSATTG